MTSRLKKRVLAMHLPRKDMPTMAGRGKTAKDFCGWARGFGFSLFESQV